MIDTSNTSLFDPASALTVATPRGPRRTSSGTPSISLRLDSLPIDLSSSASCGELSEMVLSSADLLSIRPISARARQAAAPAAAPAADPLIGMIVADRYRIVESIGRGGMGSVYKVEHVRIGKLLAMKLLAGELAHHPEAVRRFKREALTVSRLQSPNTVQVFDFGVADGLTYLVMELVNGQNLARALRTEGPMPFARLGRIIVQVCSSLCEAHDKGIVHRDIKPENIMLLSAEGGTDVAKVLDFGLAKLREAEGLNDVTCQGTILGTPNYMAPEQIRGEEVDARADVYSVGALMYRMLTGQPLFRADSQVTVLSKHLHEQPIPPCERAPELGIPPGVSRLVMRALRKDPVDRFQHIEELQALLVDELRAAGSSSVESLLDPGRLERIVRSAEPAALDAGAVATRDEVDAYERKLRRKRYGAAVTVAALVAGAAAAASLLVPRDGRVPGVEFEPNDTAAEATPLPLGKTMTGQLGKRIDASHGDRDFYSFEVPARAPGEKASLRLRVSALPSMAMCTLLYQQGFADPVGQYCVGRAGHDLSIPALELDPGRYFLAVMQDMDAYGGAAPMIQESISDAYTVLLETTLPELATEIEPNDRIASAGRVELGRPVAAAIGWAHDEDLFCASEAVSGRFRWVVRAGFREAGVLEATPMRGGKEGLPVRVHLEEKGKRTDSDVVGPWRSAPMFPERGSSQCLRVRLVADPWSAEHAALSGGSEPYFVEAEAVR